MMTFEGILPLNKPEGRTSFQMVSLLRKITNIRTIGHAGTLDPFAVGVLILLIGKPYTRLSSLFLNEDKEYQARLHLGVSTDTFDREGQITATSLKIPSLTEVEKAIATFQGSYLQTPPMFSAKKIQGQTLYNLARKGITIERQPVPVTVATTLLHYEYPFLDLQIACSKGTYIRALADDLGRLLETGAHLTHLCRTRSGSFHLKECCDISLIQKSGTWHSFLRKNR